jgi:hypothetical protein
MDPVPASAPLSSQIAKVLTVAVDLKGILGGEYWLVVEYHPTVFGEVGTAAHGFSTWVVGSGFL